ncbi:MAG: DNA-directed RNA polymerase subunit alpha C-terminal domain-containing protein [Candidatus Saccharibacteria bacterium]|nr:DNA-directed RNA polymerase subunit alpha C-terminal domain-containing protein [Candidatus Saccharibacteria bacterium]
MKTWQESFFDAVFNDGHEGEVKYPLDLENTVDSILSTLKSREEQVIRLRFVGADRIPMTLKEIGATLSPPVSRARVGEILTNAYRKIRGTSRGKLLKMGEAAHQKYLLQREAEAKAAAVKEVAAAAEAVREAKEALKKAEIRAKKAETVVKSLLSSGFKRDKNLLKDLDLSVRSYNCLSRAGFYSLGEVYLAGPESIRRIRNLGQRSFEEVIEKMVDIIHPGDEWHEKLTALRD